MKVLYTDQFVSERMKIRPVTNAEFDKAKENAKHTTMENIRDSEIIIKPTYEDICQEGNVVFVYDGNNTRSYVVMYDKEASFISLTGFSAHLNTRHGSIRRREYWTAERFKDNFPYYYSAKIVAVYKANINTEDIKTDKDLEKVLQPYNDYLKWSRSY